MNTPKRLTSVKIRTFVNTGASFQSYIKQILIRKIRKEDTV